MAELDHQEDQPGRRDVEFLKRLALTEGDFRVSGQFVKSIRAAITHALNAPADSLPAPWSPYGARNIGGSIRALAQNPLDPGILYAGGGLGGVFKSADHGDTWRPLGQPQDAVPVGAIGISPNQPDIVYIGTGDMGLNHITSGATLVANLRNAAGRGLYRFDETHPEQGLVEQTGLAQPGGAPWSAQSFARIVVDPHEPERCWLATNTGLWRREAGPVFHREPVPANPAPVAPAVGAACTDVVLIPSDRAGSYTILAAFGAVGIFRGRFDPAAVPPTVWEARLQPGLPAPSSPASQTWDRISLAVCRRAPAHVYAMAENHANNSVLAVYYSADGGDHWTARAVPVADLGTQSWYNLTLAVHPENPSLVLAGGVNLARSRNFGANWEIVLDWANFGSSDRAQHGDQHAALFDIADPRQVWIGNDGGISTTSDIVQRHPHLDRTWRKRSHGIVACHFNDITVHPTYPYMMGGGLQDNGTYVSFGGTTWHMVNEADGGQMAFEIAEPRTFVAPTQYDPAGFGIDVATVAAPDAVLPALGAYLEHAPVNADRAPPEDLFTIDVNHREVAPLTNAAGLFVSVIEHHPVTRGHLLIGRVGAVFVSTDTCGSFSSAGIPGGLFFSPSDEVSALAYGNAASATAADWWVGTSQGTLLRSASPHGAASWAARPLPLPAIPVPPPSPPVGFGRLGITRIAPHPRSNNYVAVCTTGQTAVNEQGRVYLSLDRGQHWADITGLVAVGAPAAGSPALQALPNCPCSSLAFDPQPANNQPQTLFVGTLAGVYVIRNLPAVPGAAGSNVPAFNPQWFTFNDRPVRPPEPADPARGRAPLPLTVVNDLKIQTLPSRTGTDVIANAAETVARTRLLVAMYGRGIYVCDITRNPAPGTPAGGPPARLYIRQTVIEDGLSYPRPDPTTLNRVPVASSPWRLGGDPRYPVNTVLFTDREAFDIRIDHAPFQFFEDVLDGVEFDEDLQTQALQAGASNFVYVQVHSAGWAAAGPVDVQLYYAAAPAPGQPNDAPLPDLHADFWAHWLDDPLPAPAAVPAPPAATWQRAGHAVRLTTIAANQPAVARFEWIPPSNLGAHAALLAVCSGAADPLVPGTQPTVLATLLRRERRAALRVVPVVPFVPDLYIRDGLDDIGDLGGVAWGGRSPDIIVVPSAPADPATEYADINASRSADRVRAGENFIYVRVHNRTAFATDADVELFWARPAPPTSSAAVTGGPISDNSQWQVVAAVGPAASVSVPASGHALVGFHLTDAPAADADAPGSLAFIALIRAHDGADLEPLRSRVTDLASFWRFLRELADANNAALRALRYA